MKIWIVSMECAGISEAGGVKNVTLSLCKELSLLKHDVTLFIPLFKCSNMQFIKDVKEEESQNVFLCGKEEMVSYKRAFCKLGDFKIVFICHSSFLEKEGVYTYTEKEQKINPDFVKGQGHKDSLFMDTLFQKAVAEYAKNIVVTQRPEIIHCQDAATAMIPAFIKYDSGLKDVKCVVTIHNAGPSYHHEFSSLGEAAWYTSLPSELLEKSLNNQKVEPFLLAACVSAKLTTVSEEYARELTDEKNAGITDNLSRIFAEKKIQIRGITNGFDFERYNPSQTQKSKLPYSFDPESLDLYGKYKCRKYFMENVINASPCTFDGIKVYGSLEEILPKEKNDELFVAYHGRLASQKGVSVLAEIIPSFIFNFPNIRFIVAGQGECFLENALIELTKHFPGKLVFINGYNQVVVRLVTAISDFIVLPSFFEPCGLEDFIGQCYGTLPIAHSTGGLTKISHLKTGYLYKSNSPESLSLMLSRAICTKEFAPELHFEMIKNAYKSVKYEFLWSNVIKNKYIPFFEEILST